ncbi:uncharacterized protein LOC144216957 [Crocuta crocuta]
MTSRAFPRLIDGLGGLSPAIRPRPRERMWCEEPRPVQELHGSGEHVGDAFAAAPPLCCPARCSQAVEGRTVQQQGWPVHLHLRSSCPLSPIGVRPLKLQEGTVGANPRPGAGPRRPRPPGGASRAAMPIQARFALSRPLQPGARFLDVSAALTSPAVT